MHGYKAWSANQIDAMSSEGRMIGLRRAVLTQSAMKLRSFPKPIAERDENSSGRVLTKRCRLIHRALV